MSIKIMKKKLPDRKSCPIRWKNFVYLLVLALVTTVISCDDDSDPIDNPDENYQLGAGPTITWGSNKDSTMMDIEDGMDVKFNFEVPAGIMVCRIYANSEAFREEGIMDIDLINPSDKVKTIAESILGEGGNPEGKTSYTLDLSPLGQLINDLIAEDTEHTITVMVADKNNRRTMRTAVFHRLADISAMNAALKVSMFTPFNVKSIDGGMVTFHTTLTNDADDSYFTYTRLKDLGLTAQDGSEILQDAAGNKYRLPTAGELTLLVPMCALTNGELGQFKIFGSKGAALFPCWGDDFEIAPEVTRTEPLKNEYNWVETIYLRNRLNNAVDNLSMTKETDGEFRVSGKSFLKCGEDADIVYGLRFQETSQCAAYRWEYCKIDGSPENRYLSIRIKALGKYNVTTTIDDVADESFWTGDYVEFTFPASGYYNSASGLTAANVGGLCWSSSLSGSSVHALFFDSSSVYVSDAKVLETFADAKVLELLPESMCPLRLVRVRE